MNGAPQVPAVGGPRGWFTAFMLYCSAIIGHGIVALVSTGITVSIALSILGAGTTTETPAEYVGVPYYEVQPYSLAGPLTPRANVRYRAAPFAIDQAEVVRVSVVGEALTVTGYSDQADGRWYQVVLPEGSTAFVRSDLVSTWTPPAPVEPEPALPPATETPPPSPSPFSYGSTTTTQPPPQPQPQPRPRPPPPPPPQPVVAGEVRWDQRPSADRIAELYPRRALRQGIDGRVQLDCTVLYDLRLSCRVYTETPYGERFGAAAVEASEGYRAQARLSNGASAIGARTRIVVNFRAAED